MEVSVLFLQVLDIECGGCSVIFIEPLEQAGLSDYTNVSAVHTFGLTSLQRWCLTSMISYFTNSWMFYKRIVCNVNMLCDTGLVF
jgi:hypothetical protein